MAGLPGRSEGGHRRPEDPGTMPGGEPFPPPPPPTPPMPVGEAGVQHAVAERERAVARFFDALTDVVTSGGKLLDIMVEQEEEEAIKRRENTAARAAGPAHSISGRQR